MDPKAFEEAFAKAGGAFKAAHGHVAWIGVAAGRAFFRRPNDREFLIWSTTTDPTNKSIAMGQVCRACFIGLVRDDGTVAEDVATYDAVLAEEGPMFTAERHASTAGDLIVRLAGLRARESGFL